MMTLTAAQLRKAASIREKLDKLEKQLNSILGSIGTPSPAAPRGRKPAVEAPNKPKRKMSRAARAKIAAAAKARWAKAKAAGKRRL